MPSSYQVLDFGLSALCYSVAGLLWFFVFHSDICSVLAPLTALVIFRDIGLIAAVFWVRYKTVPPPVRRLTLHFKNSFVLVKTTFIFAQRHYICPYMVLYAKLT